MKIIFAVVLAFLVSPLWSADIIRIENPSDGAPFDAALALVAENDGCRQYSVSFPSALVSQLPANNTVSGELYLPLQPLAGRHPALLVFHIIGPGNFHLERMICKMAATEGAVAMFFHLPYYARRGGDLGEIAILSSPKHFFDGLKQAQLDARRANDLLCALPEVDKTKLLATGVSLGAIMTANAVGTDPRISKALMVLGGGNLPKIFETNVRETRDLLAFFTSRTPEEQKKLFDQLRPYDPLSHANALQKLAEKGKLAMINAGDDNVIPPACSTQLAEACKCPIKWYPGVDHYTIVAKLPEVLLDMMQYFAPDCPPEWKRPPEQQDKVAITQRLLRKTLGGIAQFMGAYPIKPGKASILEATASLALQDGKILDFNVNYVLGDNRKFKLEGKFPQIGNLGLGFDGARPWMTGAKNTLFIGSENQDPTMMFSQFISPQRLNDFNVVRGAIGGAAFAPDIVNNYADVTLHTPRPGRYALTIKSKDRKVPGELLVEFDNKETPKTIAIKILGLSGTVNISKWIMNVDATEHQFDLPKGRTEIMVNQEDVTRSLAAALEYLIERTE